MADKSFGDKVSKRLTPQSRSSKIRRPEHILAITKRLNGCAREYESVSIRVCWDKKLNHQYYDETVAPWFMSEKQHRNL